MAVKDEETRLLAAWRAGDRGSGEALFERYFDGLYGFFRDKVEPNEVADLVQKTCLAWVEASASFSANASVRTYFFAIARHQLFHHYRTKRRTPYLDFDASSVTDLAPTPSSAAARGEQRRLLRDALARIPVELQIALEFRFFHDLRGPELAQVLEIPEGTVRSRLRRAIDRLRIELERTTTCSEEQQIALSELSAFQVELDAAKT